MRFLLHSLKASVARNREAHKSIIPKTNCESDISRTFGQQCSPNCGCIVRFEANIDHNSNNRIISMTYDAKAVVSIVSKSSKHGTMTLSPIFTESHSKKPLLSDCKCKTVHSLAKNVVETLQQMTLSQAQNQLEFLGVRSSPAFRYTVLRKHDLLPGNALQTHTVEHNKNSHDSIVNVEHGHCFDLIEDALTACLNGYLPKPRPCMTFTELNKTVNNGTPIKVPNRILKEMDRIEDEPTSSGLDPLRFVNAAKKRTANLFFRSSSVASLSLPSSMPPFHLMGETDAFSYDTLSELKSDRKNQLRKEEEDDIHCDEDNSNSIDNWLSYVDHIDTTQGSY